MSKKRKTRSSAKAEDPVTPAPPVNPRTVAKPATTPLSVLSLKSVWLHDWWLAPAPGKGLSVGGFESRGQGVRVFWSAAIAKRHSTTTLETTDGIQITISGFINRARTYQNGFPLEVCSHFLLGFPYYWEKHATQNHNGESADNGIPKEMPAVFGLNHSGSNMSFSSPGSLSDLPAAMIHDAILFSQRGSGSSNLIKTIMDDLLDNSSDSSSEHQSKSENKGRSKTVTPVNHRKLSNREKIKVTTTCRDNVRDRSSARTALSSSVGVITRSMSRMENLRKKSENLRPKNPVRYVHV